MRPAPTVKVLVKTKLSVQSVPDYLATLDAPQSKVLKRYLALIKKAVPTSARVLSYGIPAFKQERVFIYCAAFKKHIGIYPPVRNDARLQAALQPYANAKGNLSFPIDMPVPASIVAKVATALAKQYSQLHASKPKRRRKISRAV